MTKTLTNYSTHETEQLWSKFLQGDKYSFETIYRRYAKDLLNYGYKVTSDKKLIEDSVQDLFFELWQRREKLSHTTSIKFYLFRAIRYKIVRNVKENHADLFDLTADTDNRSDGMSPENYLIQAETEQLQVHQLKDMINKLPRRQQEAINLRYYHNFSNEEIAEIMEVNYQSACKIIYTALKNLRINLKTSAFTLIPLLKIFFS